MSAGVDRPLPPGTWAVLPEGGRPIGPGDSGADYPFVAPTGDLEGVVADLWLAYPTGATPLPPPLRLAWIHGLDRAVNGGIAVAGSSAGDDPTPVHAVDLQIVDAAARPVFDSTGAWYYAATAFGPRLVIHEWRTLGAVCRLVQHVAVADASAVRLLPRSFHPADGRLDARASVAVPRRLTALVVDPAFPVRGTARLECGYNIALTPATKVVGLRTVTTIVVDCVPGGGAGRAPGCTDAGDSAVRSINGNLPDPVTGNLNLVARDCYWARRPRSRLRGVHRDGTLQVGHDCAPCCGCADYVAIQEGILSSWDDYAALAARADAMNAQLAAMIARWEAQKACREAKAIRLNAVAYGAEVDVAVALANPTDACLYSITTTVAIFAAGSAGMTLDAAASYRVDESGASAPASFPFVAPMGTTVGSVTATWPFLPPGFTVAARFRLTLAATFTTLTLTAHGEAGGVPFTTDAIKVLSR